MTLAEHVDVQNSEAPSVVDLSIHLNHPTPRFGNKIVPINEEVVLIAYRTTDNKVSDLHHPLSVTEN